MDALPIAEQTGSPFSSQHSGRMHACGHDGHMAMALELGRRLRGKENLPHNVLLVFQPAEETTGGARRICETGVFERLRVKAIFALHLWPGLPAGTLAGLPGPMMARSAEVTFTATGRCAHFSAGSGRDALAACVAFYNEAAALSLPQRPEFLLGFGRMEAGSVRNALAGSARLEGSLRALDDAAFCSIREALKTISRHAAQTSGCEAAVHFSEGYPRCCESARSALAGLLRCFPIEALSAPSMASDDFSYYQQRLPGLFLFLGCGGTPALHTAEFDFDERVLEAGVRYYEAVAGGTAW